MKRALEDKEEGCSFSGKRVKRSGELHDTRYDDDLMTEAMGYLRLATPDTTISHHQMHRLFDALVEFVEAIRVRMGVDKFDSMQIEPLQNELESAISVTDVIDPIWPREDLKTMADVRKALDTARQVLLGHLNADDSDHPDDDDDDDIEATEDVLVQDLINRSEYVKWMADRLNMVNMPFSASVKEEIREVLHFHATLERLHPKAFDRIVAGENARWMFGDVESDDDKDNDDVDDEEDDKDDDDDDGSSIVYPLGFYDFDRELQLFPMMHSRDATMRINPLLYLVKLIATHDHIETLRKNGALEELQQLQRDHQQYSDVETRMINILIEKVTDRSQIEPYIDVLREIVCELRQIEKVKASNKRFAEVWIRVVSTAVLDRHAEYPIFNDEYPALCEDDIIVDDDQSGGSSNESDGSYQPEDDVIEAFDFNEPETDEEYDHDDDENCEVEDISHGDRATDTTFCPRDNIHQNKEAHDQESDNDKESDMSSHVYQTLPGTDAKSQSDTMIALPYLWPRGVNTPIRNILDYPSMGKSIVHFHCPDSLINSSCDRENEPSMTTSLMDQEWTDMIVRDAHDLISPFYEEESFVDLQSILDCDSGSNSMLADLVKLSRRGGIMKATAQTYGESLMLLREYISQFLAKVLEVKCSQSSNAPVTITEEDIILVQKSLRGEDVRFRVVFSGILHNAQYQEKSQDEQPLEVQDVFQTEELISPGGEDPLDMPDIQQQFIHDPYIELEYDEGDYSYDYACTSNDSDTHCDLHVSHIGSYHDRLKDVRHLLLNTSNIDNVLTYIRGAWPTIDEHGEEITPYIRHFYFAREENNGMGGANSLQINAIFHIDIRILKEWSTVFKSMFESGMVEQMELSSPIAICEYLNTELQVEAFFAYLCTGDLEAVREHLGLDYVDHMALLGAGDLYDIPHLREATIRYLFDNVSKDNVDALFRFSLDLDDATLCKSCEHWIRNNGQDMLFTRQESAEQECILSDLELDYLFVVCSETTLNNVVCKLHDILMLEEELARDDHQDIEENAPALDLARKDMGYLEHMIRHRWKEQYLWVIIRHYDTVSTTTAWNDDTLLSRELREHIGELVFKYKYSGPMAMYR